MANSRPIVVAVTASVATLVVLIGFFAAGFFVRGWWDQRGTVRVADTHQPEPGERVVPNVSADDDPFWGSENAKVTIVEFADYQCPFCRKYVKETLPQLRESYGDKVRYVFRDFPITELHPRAFQAAEAAQCAFAQGEFWRYHDLLFENPEALATADLKKYAGSVGLDMVAFESCLQSSSFKNEVQMDLDAGVKYGVKGTPAFFVNGRAIEGAASFSVLQRIIEEELAKAASGRL